jgi:hypothetical protein
VILILSGFMTVFLFNGKTHNAANVFALLFFVHAFGASAAMSVLLGHVARWVAMSA